MPCDTRRMTPEQTLQQRKDQVRKSIEKLEKALVSGTARIRIGPQGAIAFSFPELAANRVTDACAYRMIMSTGSAFARAEIAKAEQLAGRSVNKQAVNQGLHSHDGGATWHKGH